MSVSKIKVNSLPWNTNKILHTFVFKNKSLTEVYERCRKVGMTVMEASGRPGEWRCHVSGASAYKKARIENSLIPVSMDPMTIITSSDSCDRRSQFRHLKVDNSTDVFNSVLNFVLCLFFNFIKSSSLSKIFILFFVIAGAFYGGMKADGAVMVTSNPFQTGSQYGLDQSFTNDNTGVVYDSGKIHLGSLASDIYALGNSAETSAQNMINNDSNFGLQIRGAPAGEVDNGWTISATADNQLSLTNNGIIPDLSYDTWQNTVSNSVQDTMATRLTINNSLLETNGIAGYQSFNLADTQSSGFNASDYDAIIVRSDDALFSAANYNGTAPSLTSNGFTGTGASGFNNYDANGQSYHVLNSNDFNAVPEPATTALLGLGALGLTLRRNRKE